MSGAPLAFSTLDSERFGFRIFRGHVAAVDAASLAVSILDARCDIAIVRVPAGQGHRLHELEGYGLPALQADTLIYYRRGLHDLPSLPPRNAALEIDAAQARDAEALGGVVAAAFEGYSNHYRSNILLPEAGMIAGYQQWAERHIEADDSSIWLARDDGRAVGFLACRHDTAAGETEITLNGVVPEAAGAGVYTDLLRHCLAASARLGMRHVKVSTQIGNHAVQKVWAREGLHLFQAFDTYHVNALLSAGRSSLQRTFDFATDRDLRETLCMLLDEQAGAGCRQLSVTRLTELHPGPLSVVLRSVEDRKGRLYWTAPVLDAQQRIVAIGRARPGPDGGTPS